MSVQLRGIGGTGATASVRRRGNGKRRARRGLAALAALTLTCIGLIGVSGPASAATPAPPGTAALAQQLLSSGRLSGNAEPLAQISAYASGTVLSHVISGQARDCVIDPAILSALRTVVVDKGFSVKVSSLNRYCIGDSTSGGGTASYHYRSGGGHAVDISIVNGVVSTGNTSADRALIAAMFTALPGPAAVGQQGCNGRTLSIPSGWSEFADTCNHNHFEYRGGALPVVPTFDYSGDGFTDFLAIRDTGILTLYKGNGAGGFSSGVQAGNGWTGMVNVLHGDYNGDAKGDLIASDPAGELRFYPGNGAGGFGAKQSVGNGWQAMSLVSGGADFTSDGKADIVARKTADGTLWLYKGNGSGGFPTSAQIGPGWGGTAKLMTGDFNGDGKGDLLSVDSAGSLWFYAGNGAGGFATKQGVGNGWTTAVDLVAGGGDYNGDGKADVLARKTADNTLWLYEGNGSGALPTSVQIGPGWGAFVTLI